MTAALSAPAVDSPADRRWRAMSALARVESVRMLRSPVTIAAAVLFLAPWVYEWISGTANKYPVLHYDSVDTQFLALLVLGNATLLAANFAALRPHRHRADTLFDVLVLPTAWRTGALLLAVLAPTLLSTVLVGVRVGVPAALPGAAGRLLPLDLLAVPASVALCGVLGVLLARVTRSAVIAPVLALFLTAFVFVFPVGGSSGSRYGLLLPVITPEAPMPFPADLVGHSSGPHLVYVIGLIGVFAALALLRSGARPRLWLAGVLALAVTLTGAVSQYRDDGSLDAARRTATDAPATVQQCRTIDDVRYCAFEGFAPWVDSWDEVLRGVRRAVPGGGGSPLVVRQRVLAVGYPVSGVQGPPIVPSGPPEEIAVGTEWGDPPASAAFASSVAYRLVTGHAPQDGRPLCGSQGALLVWLVGQSGGTVAAGLRDLDDRSWGALYLGDLGGYSGITVPDADAATGTALLGKPGAAALVAKHWDELSASVTDAGRFAALVGVAAAPQPPAEEQVAC